MRTLIAGLGLLTALALSAPASAACNARGEFCEFPNWASNAFAGRERVPESSLAPDRHQRVKRQSSRVDGRRGIAATRE
jgi:hypothetical protein